MTKKRFFIGIIVILVMVAIVMTIVLCSSPSSEPSNPSKEDQALEALITFLNALYSGDYNSAARIYGGSYEILTGYNPDLDSSDPAALLERACTTNGFNCLQLKNVISTESTSENEFTFYVELQLDNGEPFEIGPCCGADEEGFVPISTFGFRVFEIDKGQFQVLDLPPYTP